MKKILKVLTLTAAIFGAVALPQYVDHPDVLCQEKAELNM